MKNYKRILQKAKKIKLIAMDIDGVLTRGELIILESGEEIKIWDIKDRFAYTILRRFLPEIKLAWITGRKSKQIQQRAEELKINFLYQKCLDKSIAFNEILQNGFKPEEIAYIGDDWLDISLLKRVGLAICPKDAPKEVRNFADYVTERPGGTGVFREVVELILKAKNLYEETFKYYTK
ncbi:MAG: HAD hydrolase family protein [Elusimicrobiota bacterium]|nr:HAD hydrolase family protein [Elusimicrobiota bacterium]